MREVLRTIWRFIRWQAAPIPLRQSKPKQLEIDWHTKAANGVDE